MRNELFSQDGTLLRAEIIDVEARTLTVEEHGAIVSSRPLTDDEVDFYAPKPDAFQSAVGKLQALGLTEAEAHAIIGG